MNTTLQLGPATTVSERRGEAMGTRFHIVVHGASDSVADELCNRLIALERLWSRFRHDSEISQLNVSPESFHIVSTDTIDLIDASLAAWTLTNGAFDPTVLHAITAAGYDRTLEACGHEGPVPAPTPAPGCAGIELDHRLAMVRLGAGVGFDPGGIGKGFAADRLVEHGLSSGAIGVMVNIGGDVVCGGTSPSPNGWVVEVREPSVSHERIALIALEQGAVVTSTTARRTWATGDGERHHLIDPATGECTDGAVLATVVASAGWFAEAVAKQLLVGFDTDPIDTCPIDTCPIDTCPIDTEHAAAIVLDEAGTTTHVGRIAEYLR